MPFIAICCLLFSSIVESFDISGYPAEWPDLDMGPLTSCHSINGTFESAGTSSSTISPAFEQPVFERNFYGMESIASASNYFQIEVDDDQRELVARIFNKDHSLLAVKSGGRQFECLDGWITFSSRITGGNGESPHNSSDLTTRMSIAGDGSLIINSHLIYKSREFVFFKKTQVSEIWYRYPPHE